MSKVKFKDVPVFTGFGLGDYFHWKNSPTTAIMEASGEVNEWEPNTLVVLEEEEDELSERERLLEMGCALDVEYPDEEDFLSGVTCNPDAPEECESCQ